MWGAASRDGRVAFGGSGLEERETLQVLGEERPEEDQKAWLRPSLWALARSLDLGNLCSTLPTALCKVLPTGNDDGSSGSLMLLSFSMGEC